MKATTIRINPSILTWARSRAELDLLSLAQKLKVSEDVLEKWEAGIENPTFKQAQNFAHHTFIPLGYLFLDSPPEEKLPITDFRTVDSTYHQKMSPDLIDTIKIILQRQEWYRDYMIENGFEKLSFIGTINLNMTVKNTVDQIRKLLELQNVPTKGTFDDYFRTLVSRIENIGVLVMRGSVVGNSKNRKLNVEEFRGIALADTFAPVIFINENDSLGARIFTLLHEFTHILLGESGVSDIDRRNHRNSEKFCNAVAAEFLCPETVYKKLWNDNESLEQNLSLLAKKFRVSKWVIARRALDFNFINEDTYNEFIRKSIEEFNNLKKKDIAISFYNLQPGRVSKKFAGAVVSEALSGRMLLRDASMLIGIKPEKMHVFARKAGL